MPVLFALLLSLALHALALFVLPPAAARKPVEPPPLDVRLRPAELAMPENATAADDAVAQSVTTLKDAAPPPLAPPPPTAAPAAATPVPQAAPTPRRLEGQALRRAQGALSAHLYYPPEAVDRGLEGEVVVLLQLDERGRVLTADIARSSGHALLDSAALDAARRIGALPGNPRQTLLPVSFRLQ